MSTALGGVVAAGLGAGAMWFGMPNLPEQWRPEGLGSAPAVEQVDYAPQIAAAKSQALAAVEQQTGRVEALAGDLATLQKTAGPSGQLQARLNEMQTVLEAQNARLTQLANRPASGAPVDVNGIEAAAVAAAQSKADQIMTDLRGEMEAMRSAAADEQAAAEAAAALAQKQAAVAGLTAALNSGASLEAPLADLNAAGVETPAALSGDVPALEQLTEGFAPAARTALAAAAPLEAEGQGAFGRIGAFLKAQTGARSVGGAREGTDADAVLSRAEAALQAGDVGAALDETGALPQPALDAMSGWLSQANAYVDARNAVADLAQNLK